MNLLSSLVLAALIGGTPLAATAAGDAKASTTAIAAAEDARKNAAKVDGEWRDVGKTLKKAKQAAKEGDHATAVKLADKARDQADMGYQQAIEQKDVGFPSIMQ
jgi:hypothetical protein